MSFREIAGHRHLFSLMTAAAMRGTLPPSLIFAGPEGVGKKLAAVALAQLLNCPSPVATKYEGPGEDGVPPPKEQRAISSGSQMNEQASSERAASASAPSMFDVASDPDINGPWEVSSERDPRNGADRGSELSGNDACGVCASCRRIARGVHADVLVVEPGDTGVIKVDQVRDAIDRAAYRPFEGRRRVVIVDAADLVLTEAQNALLKTLEEPPAASTFVLVTSRPDVLLPTVRSRCQRLRFGRLAPAEIASVLARDHGYAEVDAHAAASMSDGSVGLALEGGSDGYVEAREAAARLLQGAAGSSDPRRRLDGAKLLTGGGAANRDELARRLRALASLLRDVGVLIARADEGILANTDLKPLLSTVQQGFDGERVLTAFAAVDRALLALDGNASPKIVADWIAFQI
jgi:DNA polymerase-3 subunit delta'